MDQADIDTFRDLPGDPFGSDQVKDQLRCGTGLWKNITVISKSGIADMMVDTGHPFCLRNQPRRFPKPVRVSAVLYDQQICLWKVCHIADDFICAQQKFEYIRNRLQIQLCLNIRMVFLDIIIGSQAGSSTVPVRFYMARNSYAPGAREQLFQIMHHLFEPHLRSLNLILPCTDFSD